MRALLADIGGTNARFALLAEDRIGPPVILPVSRFPTPEAAMAAALERLAPGQMIDAAVLAVAGPVSGGTARLTNAPWRFEEAAIAAHFGVRRARLVNDFQALAHALPHLPPTDLVAIGAGVADPSAPMLVLGPGTGLGCAALVPTAAGPQVVPTEGGHIGLAPTDAVEDAVVAGLRARCGRAGAEEALSGRGIANLHAVVAALHGAAVPERDAAAVVGAAEECPVAAEAMRHFLMLLAGFAGDVALAWGARGGVFLAGGIMPRLAATLDRAAFRARFEDKAPMAGWMAGVPLAIVTHPAPAFPGLAAIAAAE
ncbi:ROK family protein [Roseomonas stagni]|uniref:ROK family protein n=1 Tax=Falsiroseomonas algicola TaxID=2716930 RepID=A0A6M1LIT0_9PROT|nr:glucokinase [Falsiroseomonas algicola]NGM20238.1 ROK family protein [Falsiroseomonas algicola]